MPIVTSQLSKELERILEKTQDGVAEMQEVVDAIYQYVSSTRSEVQDILALITQINRRLLDVEDALRKITGSEVDS